MIEIIHKFSPLPCPAKMLRETARAVYAGEGLRAAQKTALILCSDYAVRKLNRDFRGKDKATDVLSFPFRDADLLGEIYISLQRAKVQARQYGVTYNEELRRLLIHGLLHLAGYDHIKKSDRKIMEAKEAFYIG